jgi:hypothetical protein
MCLPLNCLKCFVQFGSTLTLLLSFVSLGFGFYLVYESTHGNFAGIGIILNLDLYYDRTEYYKNVIEYSLLVFGFLTFFVGLFGCIGAKRKQPCCLFLFNIGTIIFCVFFLSFGIVADVLSK